jgi:membrane associated rhomboid family serine protease
VIPLPISDDNPRERTPVVTVALILVNVVVWLFQLSQGVEESVVRYGAVPWFIVHGVREGTLTLPDGQLVAVQQSVQWPLTILTSMFSHGGWMHLIGNMWFLWIFGDNLEDRMGPVRYLLFYLVCGLAAAAAQIFSMPSAMVPMVGASGAIAGVLGGYILLYPHARVRCLWILFILITTIRVPAWLLLGLWFVSQFAIPDSAGVAYLAHVGGFVAGLILVKLFVTSRPAAYRRVPRAYP